MALNSGTKLGPYEIQHPLGAGGMGEVYLARDTRLERTVAVKILPPHLSSNADAKQRFEREARAISSLNHPNICTLHDVGFQDGTDFLVMEYLEGDTLADRLAKGPLPPEQVLKYGADICEGLERAHKSGVIHRDLKPGNIMITKSGAKLMDFGLAKATLAQSAVSSLTMTMSAVHGSQPLTQQGTVLGTFQYMSPEQLEGVDADVRSDIFSLGAVLYEMASGRPAFAGKSQATVVAAILASEPQPISTVQPMSPPALDRVVRTCMAKDPDDRWQTAHDVKLQLKWIAEAGSQAGVPAPVAARRKSSQRAAWIVATFGVIAAIAFAAAFFLRAQQAVHPMRVSILPPEKHSFDPLSVALSPDGTMLAFVASQGANSQLWVRPLDSLTAQPLAGTEGASFPFWSPDSRNLGFFADGKLKITPASGGAVQTLADAAEGRGGAWSKNGTILYTPAALGSLLSIPAAGGTPSPAMGDEKVSQTAGSPRWPAFLPDGQHYLFFQFRSNQAGTAGDIELGTLGSSKSTVLVTSDYRAIYASDRLIFVRGGNLMTQELDLSKEKLVGTAIPIAEQVRGDARGAAAFSLSQDGKLIFAGGQSVTLQLGWYDRTGKLLTLIDSGTFQDVHVSHDGKKVSAAKADAGGHLEIYVYDQVRATKSQFSFSQSRDDDPVWSPDNETIVFDSARNGRIDLYTRPANGSRQEELLYHDEIDKYPSDWSNDGKYLAYETVDANTHFAIWMMPMFGDRKPFPFLKEQYNVRYPVFSPDGKWVTFTSFESGHPQVYVVSFPTPGGRFLVGDGQLSTWNPNGKEILYYNDHSGVTSVDVTAHGDSLELGQPKTLFTMAAASANQFAMSPDGQSFLMFQAPVLDSDNLNLVVNWPQELKK